MALFKGSLWGKIHLTYVFFSETKQKKILEVLASSPLSSSLHSSCLLFFLTFYSIAMRAKYINTIFLARVLGQLSMQEIWILWLSSASAQFFCCYLPLPFLILNSCHWSLRGFSSHRCWLFARRGWDGNSVQEPQLLYWVDCFFEMHKKACKGQSGRRSTVLWVENFLQAGKGN